MHNQLKYLFWAFFIGLFFPSAISFSLGSLRLTLYRVALIFFILSIAGKLTTLCKPSLKNPNFLMLAYTVWAALALIVNHGFTTKLETSGVYFLEVLGPYLLVITYCTNVKRIMQVVNAYLVAVALTLIITIPETLTGVNWLSRVLGATDWDIGKRLGLYRSYGTFDHPILQGVFASTAISLAWFTQRYKLFICASLATITSVSSGAILSVFVQIFLVIWEKITKTMRNRWLILLIILVVGYFAVDLVSNRSPMRAILSKLTMSPHTAYWRMLIWDYGLDNVYKNPFFGIGFHDWERPYWMYSGSMDAFWLVSMVRYGFPAFFLYAGAFGIVIYQLLKLKTYTKEHLLLRRGWLTGMAGLAISSCTVHLWNNSFVFINFYLGLGAAMLFVFKKEAKNSAMGNKNEDAPVITNR